MIRSRSIIALAAVALVFAACGGTYKSSPAAAATTAAGMGGMDTLIAEAK